MSWYRKANPPLKTHYVVVEPEVYYEWKHNGCTPDDVKLAYGNVRQIKSFDRMIFAVDQQEAPIPVDKLVFVSGKTKSRNDLLLGYKKLGEQLQSSLELFVEAMRTRKYFIDPTQDKLNLYYIKESDNKNAQIINYGSWKDISEKARQTQLYLNSAAKPDNYKARDLTALHALTRALLEADYDHPVDERKIAVIVKDSGQKPVSTTEVPWNELHTKLDKNAKEIFSKISQFNKLKWVQEKKDVL